MAEAQTPVEILKEVAGNVGNLVTKAADLEKRLAVVEKAPVYDVRPNGPADAKEAGRWGFKSFGHFLDMVRRGGRDGRVGDEVTAMVTKGMQFTGGVSFVNKAALGLNEAVDSEGGWLAPPTFSNNIWERVYSNDILSRCDSQTIGGRTMKFPGIDESSRADGVRGYVDGTAVHKQTSTAMTGPLSLRSVNPISSAWSAVL